MTTQSLTTRSLFAVGLLIVLIVGVASAVTLPLIGTMQNFDQSIAEAEEQLVRFRASALQQDQLHKQFEILTEQQSANSRLLEGSKPDLVAAGLQNQAKQVIAAQGGVLKSMQTLQPGTEEDLVKVAIRVAMTAETKRLQKIFYALESSVPFLFLDNVDIRQSARVISAAGQSVGESLDVRFDIYGYIGSQAS